MWTLILPPLIRFLLSALLKQVPMQEVKDKAKEWVYDTVPGSKYDKAAWEIIEAAWDIILEQVNHEIGKGIKLSGLTEDEKTDVVWKVTSHAAAALYPEMQVIASHQLFNEASRVV